MKIFQKHTCLIIKTLAYVLLTIVLLAACGGSSKAPKSINTRNLAAAAQVAEPTMPKVVLTIPPTSTVTATSTQLPPTATAQNTPTATQTKVANTPTNEPSDIPTSTETIAPTESIPTETIGSDCPQGCLQESPGCDIKGNINNEGVKIYHLPSQNYYNKTIISPEKGERWFCTSTEAEANGWRASQR